MTFARLLLPLGFLIGLAHAQELKLTDPVVKLNGRTITRGDLEEMIDSLPEKYGSFYKTNPRDFLNQLAFIEYLSAYAEKTKLLETSPYRHRYEFLRNLMLHEFLQEHEQNHTKVDEKDVRAVYDQNLDRFTTAKVRVIYVSFVTPPAPGLTESEAKDKAARIHAELTAGGDFIKLVKQYSEYNKDQDGELGNVAKSDPLPDPVKAAIFALEKGKFSPPIRHDNGFYIFLCEDRKVEPYADVSQQLSVELRQQKFRAWLADRQRESKVELLNEAYFKGQPGQIAPQPDQAKPDPVKKK
jgi:hypothetical protein